MIAKLALVAALTGSGIGAAVVLAGEPASKAAKVLSIATPVGEPTSPPLPARDARLVVQVPDGKGGAPWAVRRFAATLENGSVTTCFELGRLDGERFGWIGLDGGFATVRPGHSEAPRHCRDPGLERAIGASVQRFTTLEQRAGGVPRPLETVTFGVAAPTVARVLPADEPPLSPGTDGVVLRIVPREAPSGRLTGEVEYRDGRRVQFNGGGFPRAKGEQPVAGTETVAARAPDPAGGEPWALIAMRGDRGGACLTSPGRLVGTRLGLVDRRLGVFYTGFPPDPASCRDAERAPTRTYPMRMTTLGSSIGGDDPRGRIERRVLENRTVFSGRVHADVVSVTIRTPRDVRTLVPSGTAHAILSVYDGSFPTGKVTATARLKDGREVKRSLYAG